MQTPFHQNVKGTKISMIPPVGFTTASNFSGFEQGESNSSIMIVNMPGSFSEVADGITKESLLQKGVEVRKIETRVVEGLPARLVTGRQESQGQLYLKYILTFGSEDEIIVITCACPVNLKKTAAAIKASLLTIQYDPEEATDPLESLDYTIDASATGLKFGQYIALSLLFTSDGQVPPAAEDKDLFLVTKSFKEIHLIDKKLYALNRVRDHYSAEVKKIDSIRKINVDDISGYEILAPATTPDGELKYLYQVILFSDKLYYLFLGITDPQNQERVKGMKKAVRTFRRR